MRGPLCGGPAEEEGAGQRASVPRWRQGEGGRLRESERAWKRRGKGGREMSVRVASSFRSGSDYVERKLDRQRDTCSSEKENLRNSLRSNRGGARLRTRQGDKGDNPPPCRQRRRGRKRTEVAGRTVCELAKTAVGLNVGPWALRRPRQGTAVIVGPAVDARTMTGRSVVVWVEELARAGPPPGLPGWLAGEGGRGFSPCCRCARGEAERDE